jgi:hypothetical protein
VRIGRTNRTFPKFATTSGPDGRLGPEAMHHRLSSTRTKGADSPQQSGTGD